MKKFSYLALVLVMVTLVGCGNAGKAGKTEKVETEASTVEVETESVEETVEESSTASEESENSDSLALEDNQYAIYVTDIEDTEFSTFYNAVACDSNTEKYRGLIKFILLEDAVDSTPSDTEMSTADINDEATEETEATTAEAEVSTEEETETTEATGEYVEEVEIPQLSIGSYYIVDTDGIATMSIPPQMRITTYRLATDDEIVAFNVTRAENSTFEEDFERIKTEEPAVAYGDALLSQYTWSYEQIEVFKAYVEEQKQTSDELKAAWEKAEEDAGIALGY